MEIRAVLWASGGVPRWVRHRLVFDTLFAAALCLISAVVALGVSDSLGLDRPEGLIDWVVLFGPNLAVPFRRIVPTAATIVGALLQAVLWGTQLPDFYLAMAVLLYSASAYGGARGRRWSWIAAVGLTTFVVIGVVQGEAPLYAIAIVGLFSAAASATGMGIAGRQAYTEEVEARALDAERSRSSDRERALTEERNRIARELHDVVAHGLSVVVVQAAAAQRILDRDPDGARSALHQIEQTGRTALSEMRHVLKAVRTDPSESWRPAPGLAGLDELIADLAKTGLSVALDDKAGASDGAEALPVTVDMTAYRIVQESLTNVLKHGGRGAKAAVEIDRTAGSLEVAITDNGRGAAAEDGGGHGLQGMQERVEIFGGRFEAGPVRGGGYAVRASLPLNDAVDSAPNP